jgi:hypothetical protein
MKMQGACGACLKPCSWWAPEPVLEFRSLTAKPVLTLEHDAVPCHTLVSKWQQRLGRQELSEVLVSIEEQALCFSLTAEELLEVGSSSCSCPCVTCFLNAFPNCFNQCILAALTNSQTEVYLCAGDWEEIYSLRSEGMGPEWSLETTLQSCLPVLGWPVVYSFPLYWLWRPL